MKQSLTKTLFAGTVAGLLTACNGGSGFQPASPGAPNTASTAGHRSGGKGYQFTVLGTLGGTFSYADGINNRRWATGAAALSGDATQHAVLWKNGGSTHDLGTLGGPNSIIGFAVKANSGLISGVSDVTAYDPLGENFCGNNVPNACLGFAWKNGSMSALPTLGGNNGEAAGVNDRGQLVGWAESSTHDSSCIAPQVLDWFGVIWEPKHNKTTELPPFPGDAISGALGINARGDAVGGSGLCGPVSFAVSVHAVLWRGKKVTNLGSFGGSVNNIAIGINASGEVVGQSDLPGDSTAHAFSWRKGTMTDLGTLPGDTSSVAFDINSRGQIVGQSCDASGNCRAVLWYKGQIVDLNMYLPPSSSLALMVANGINDNGEIAGQAFDSSSGDLPAFVAVPCGDCGETVGHARAKVILPERVRMQLKVGRGFRHAVMARIAR